TYALSPAKYLSFGVNTKNFQSKSDGLEQTDTLYDIGTLIYPGIEGLSFGVSFQNTNGQKDDEFLSETIRYGIAYKQNIKGNSYLLADTDLILSENGKTTKQNFGMEALIDNSIFIRCGK
ncbi:MAG: hypothetical protein KKG87_01550, partial [Elusimicrobia bacterium]|nr:hypothetical protein [Elusimicrobiota bacterium]